MEILQNPLIVPLGALGMVVAVVIVDCVKTLRERELEAQFELRLREMEHERRMRELQVDRLRPGGDPSRKGGAAC